MDRLLEATYQAEREHFWFRGLNRFAEPLIAEALEGRTAPRMLDCGFGTGAQLRQLSAHGWTCGFDLSLGGVEYARLYGQHRLVQASAVAIPFAGETFDLVTLFDVLACLDADGETRVLAEVHRVLKPGGAVFVNSAALPMLRGQHAVFGGEVRRTTRRELRAALGAAGFSVRRLTYTNFSLFPITLAVRTSQRLMGLATPEETGADIHVPPAPVNAVLTSLLALESAALRVVNMPIGSSLLALAFRR